ncbi:MAG: site-2 protease family protein, partial [Eubacteriales bacterium]
MSGLETWLRQLEFGGIFDTLWIVAASLLCITVHETCHGLVAYWLGDPTAKKAGRLTLNPIAHVDLMGLIMMALVKFGWAKPVPVDMRYFKNPKGGMALVALAGPVSNVLLALLALAVRILMLAAVAFQPTGVVEQLVVWMEYIAIISSGLAVFNLIPISPLDGSKVLFSFLSQEHYRTLMKYERYGMLVMMALLFLGVLDVPLMYL